MTSFTDFVSNRTEYKYDDAGRISAVAPKNGIEAGTLFSWSNNGSPVRTESRCMLNSANTACATSSALLQTVTHYDSMLRPTKVSTTDIANNYTINQSFRHDYANQKTFESFKYTGASETNGITTVFDGLGRPSTVSTSFDGTMTTEYLTNNRNKVTKEYNGSTSYDTTTQYLAFGAPNHKNAIEII